MAEEQKPVVELPKEETPATTIAAPAAVETKPVEETPVVATEAAPVAAAEETKPVETTEAAAETEAAKPEEKKEEEVKPIEEGYLSHKAQGLSFPKNLIASKEFFFFGTEAVEPKSLAAYQKSEKSTETAHANIAWASHTGKGLLFVGDKKTPSSIINLSDATEPETDGSNKFHLTSKGNKHTFKAATTAERDNWVAQLKLKIAEAKELSATVVEAETYKQTLESFKPVVPVKKEAEPVKEEAAKTEETPKVEEAVKEEETPKEAAKEELKAEEPKRRSASRKRTSFFGFGKKEEKKDEVKAEEPAAVVAPEAVVPAVEDKPAEVEAPKVEEAPAAEIVADAPVAAPVAEDKPVEVESPKTEEAPKEKPTASKRNSFFGGVFGKKEKKAAEAKPVEATEAPKEAEVPAATETAPVIPPVETTTPLAVDVANPATVPVETTEVPAATATNGETKKDVKEKHKSSLPFAFGKRDKSPSPAEGEEKSPLSAFSKFRATIKGKTTPKAEEKPVEAEAAKEETVKATDAEAKPEETPAEVATEEPAKPVAAEPEAKPENVATTTPAVTAAA